MDQELQKVQRIINKMTELEALFYKLDKFESPRIRGYFSNRYQYFWDWLLESLLSEEK